MEWLISAEATESERTGVVAAPASGKWPLPPEWLISAEATESERTGAASAAAAPASGKWPLPPFLKFVVDRFFPPAVITAPVSTGPGFRAVSSSGDLRRPMLRGSEILTLKALARDIYDADPEATAASREAVVAALVQAHIAALRPRLA